MAVVISTGPAWGRQGAVQPMSVRAFWEVNPTFATRALESCKRLIFRGWFGEGRHHSAACHDWLRNVRCDHPGRRLVGQGDLQTLEQDGLVHLGFRVA